MKRILTTVAALLMVIVLCCSVCFATAPTSFYLEEMNADIGLPSWEDFYFLYPDMPEDNPDLGYLEMTPQDINNILIANGILFDALYYDASYEIAVQVNADSSVAMNYSELSEAERASVLSATKEDLQQTGFTIRFMDWVVADNGVWMVVEFVQPGGSWAYQYHTALGGKILMFTASSAQNIELTDEIREVTAQMALNTVFHSDSPVPGDVPGSAEGGNGLEDVDLGEADAEQMAQALGLSMEELEQLLKGEMSPNDLDLNQVDLEGLVGALGMSEEDVHDIIRTAVGVEDLDLSGLKLNEVDVAALLDATGLTVDDVVKMGQGETSPADFDMSQVDPEALLDALGLSGEDLINIALSAAGLGDFDWKGLLASAGRGAAIGFGAGVVVVILIVVLLAVTGRKKKAAVQAEVPAVENSAEE